MMKSAVALHAIKQSVLSNAKAEMKSSDSSKSIFPLQCPAMKIVAMWNRHNPNFFLLSFFFSSFLVFFFPGILDYT